MTAPAILVTGHAIQRFHERIDARATEGEVEAEILAARRTIRIAAAFGCHCVRTKRARLIVDGLTVVSIYSNDLLPGRWQERGQA